MFFAPLFFWVRVDSFYKDNFLAFQTKKVGKLITTNSLLKYQYLPRKKHFYLIVMIALWCPYLWATQRGMVVVEKAVIYSDKEMTSPIGFVARGKTVVVGEVPRNRAQVYPILVSGKVAYIRVADITTEAESPTSDRLVAERFHKAAQDQDFKGRFSTSIFVFNSKVSGTGVVPDEAFSWTGLSTRVDIMPVRTDWEAQVVANIMKATTGDVSLNAVEFGFGLGYRFIQKRKYVLRGEAQLLGVPFVSYEVPRYRVNSWGYTMGAGGNFSYFFDKRWGAEVYGGLFSTKLNKFDTPAGYASVEPKFVGMRMGLGVNYKF